MSTNSARMSFELAGGEDIVSAIRRHVPHPHLFARGHYTVSITFEGSRVPEPGEAPDGGGILGHDEDEDPCRDPQWKGTGV